MKIVINKNNQIISEVNVNMNDDYRGRVERHKRNYDDGIDFKVSIPSIEKFNTIKDNYENKKKSDKSYDKFINTINDKPIAKAYEGESIAKLKNEKENTNQNTLKEEIDIKNDNTKKDVKPTLNLKPKNEQKESGDFDYISDEFASKYEEYENQFGGETFEKIPKKNKMSEF